MGMQVTDLHLLRDQLLVRREKLENAITRSQAANLVQLLEQVDRALQRVDGGSYGLCDHCHGTIEAERLLADPLAQLCLDCLKPEQQRALEQDLKLASRIQAGFLPKQDFTAAGWKVFYHYEPAGVVSGDYCDLLAKDGYLYFMLGDVSGKGVAASMLTANLHALFRVLIPTGLPLDQLVERANNIFSESTLPTQYATLICGRADRSGVVEICNGGHLPPLHIGDGGVNIIQSSALPIGLFRDQKFSTATVRLAPGESLLLYTDGISEAENADGTQYGQSGLTAALQHCRELESKELVSRCIEALLKFRAGSAQVDDQTLMVLRFAPVEGQVGLPV